MNQRIYTLSEIAKTQVPKGTQVELWIQRYNEELTKLVVAELTSLVRAVDKDDPAVQTIADLIEKHFEFNHEEKTSSSSQPNT